MTPGVRACVLAGLAVLGGASASAGAAESGRIPHAELRRLVRACAADVSPTTQAAIVAVESGGDAWALHDDNDGTVYAPRSYGRASALASDLVARDRAHYGSADRGVDVGLAQINSANFAGLGVTAALMLDPCENLRASARIIRDAYLRERAIVASDPTARGDQTALRRALQVYNSGRDVGDDAYVRAVFGAVADPLVRDAGDAVRAPVVLRPVAPPARRVLVLGDAVYLPDATTNPIPPRRPRPRPSGPPAARDRASAADRRSSLFVHVDDERDGEAIARPRPPDAPQAATLAGASSSAGPAGPARREASAFIESGGDVAFPR